MLLDSQLPYRAYLGTLEQHVGAWIIGTYLLYIWIHNVSHTHTHTYARKEADQKQGEQYSICRYIVYRQRVIKY